MEWQNLLWLLLLIPLFVGLFLRRNSNYILKTHSPFLIGKSWKRFLSRTRFILPSIFAFLAMISIIAASIDINRVHTAVGEKKIKHRIFVWVDSSSSMYNFSTPMTSITCEKNAKFFPKINGACRALYRLIKDVSDFAEKKTDSSEKDLVGIGQFATYSYVISYPSNDYRRLNQKIDKMEFKSSELGIFTNIHLGMWDMYLMALDRNMRREPNFTPLSGKELKIFAFSVVPGRLSKEYSPPRELKEKISLIKNELSDTVFVFITDALKHQMDQAMNKTPYSLYKQMQLAAFLEVPVIYISTDDFHQELKRLSRLTGFGPAGGKHRGDFLMVKKERDFQNIAEIVSNILQTRFNMTVPVPVLTRKSYSEWLISAALTFSVIVLVLLKTISRSLTGI